MAAMIGRTRGWVIWLAGALCALVFGRDGLTGERYQPMYGVGVGPRQAEREPAGKVATLDEAPEWKQLVGAWAEAEKLVARKWDGRTTSKPDEEPKKGVLAGLEGAKKGVGILSAGGLLSAGEAELLGQGLNALSGRVRSWATIPPMCYAPPPAFAFERDAAKRLADRLPLLEKLVAQKKVAPAVAGKLLASLQLINVDDDLARLADGKRLAGMPADERAKIIKTRDAATEALKRLRALAEESAKPDAALGARIEALLDDLGANEFAKREAASVELAKIGVPALAALRRTAAASEDAEVIQRAKKAIAAIEGRPEPAPTPASLEVNRREMEMKLKAEAEAKARKEDELKRRAQQNR